MHSPLRSPIPVETLLLAYRSGIFPMADARDDLEVFWVEPKDRAIIPLDRLHVSKSLRKVLRADRYIVTMDKAFDAVVRACAAPRPGHPDTWISDRIIASYTGLHHAGHAHSIECWRAHDRAAGGSSGEEDTGPPQLVGGLYGVAFDRVFCGESMFSHADNASKVALCWLVAVMRQAGFGLLDCQFMTDHLATMGAMDIPQPMYLKALARSRGKPLSDLARAFDELSGGQTAGQMTGQSEEASSPGKRIAQSLTQTS